MFATTRERQFSLSECSRATPRRPVITMAHRKYQELFWRTERFTPGTRTCLERAVGDALFGHRNDGWPLRAAVCRATRELRAQGLDVSAVLAILGVIVEDAGRACGADRSSLLSGEPLWMGVRTRVLEAVRRELREGSPSGSEVIPLAGVIADQ
jgi:hypothetical protein